MNRGDTFTMRVTEAERRLLAELAAYLERNESDAVRFLLREKARELSLPASQSDDRRPTLNYAAIH